MWQLELFFQWVFRATKNVFFLKKDTFYEEYLLMSDSL